MQQKNVILMITGQADFDSRYFQLAYNNFHFLLLCISSYKSDFQDDFILWANYVELFVLSLYMGYLYPKDFKGFICTFQNCTWIFIEDGTYLLQNP